MKTQRPIRIALLWILLAGFAVSASGGCSSCGIEDYDEPQPITPGNDDDSGDDDDGSGNGDDDDGGSGDKSCRWPIDIDRCTAFSVGDDDDDGSGNGDDDDDDGGSGGKNCGWPINIDECSAFGVGDDDDDDDDDGSGGKSCGWPIQIDACTEAYGAGGDDDDDGSGNGDDDDDGSGGKACGFPMDLEACAEANGVEGGDDDDSGDGNDDDGSGGDDDDDGSGDDDDDDGGGKACGWPPSIEACAEDNGYGESDCGNGIIEEGEICDFGRKCVGGINDGFDCSDDADFCAGGDCANVELIIGDLKCSADCFDITDCGNGEIDADRGETCDDGEEDNLAGTFGCNENCQSDDDGESQCGDGAIGEGEICDHGRVCDGGDRDGQSCTDNPAHCRFGECVVVESTVDGVKCSADCFDITLCGNDVIDSDRGEMCDDGPDENLSGVGGCNESCQLADADDDDDSSGGIICGNGVVETGEICDGEVECVDPAGYLGTKSCSADCQSVGGTCIPQEYCGDSVVNGEEICDPGQICVGGTHDGLECNPDPAPSSADLSPNDCLLEGGECKTLDRFEPGFECNASCRNVTLCGNGEVNPETGEECDDGEEANLTGEFNCSVDCRSVVPVKWISAPLGRVTGALALNDGGDWVLAASDNGNLYFLNSETGATGQTHAAGSPLITHPTVDSYGVEGDRTFIGLDFSTDEVIYQGTNGGDLLAITLNTSGNDESATAEIAELWSLNVGSPIQGGPTIGGLQNFLYFSEGETGQMHARNHLEGRGQWYGFYYDDGKDYPSLADRDQPAGDPNWSVDVGGTITGEAVIGANGRDRGSTDTVYFYSLDLDAGGSVVSRLYAYHESGRIPCSGVTCGDTHTEAEHPASEGALAHSWDWWLYWNLRHDECIHLCGPSNRPKLPADRTEEAAPMDYADGAVEPDWYEVYDAHGRFGSKKWELELNARIVSGPVLDGNGQLYVGIDNGVSGALLAIRESDGSVVWEFPLGEDCRTLTCGVGSLCVGNLCQEDCGNVCINGSECVGGTCSDGRPCAPRACPGTGTCQSGRCVGNADALACGVNECSPRSPSAAVIGPAYTPEGYIQSGSYNLYFGAGQSVRALRIIEDNTPVVYPQELWSDTESDPPRIGFETDGWVYAAPTLARNGVLYVGTMSGNFYALDTFQNPFEDEGKGPEDFKFQIWRFRTNGRVLSPSAVDGGAVFFATDRVIALYAAEGFLGGGGDLCDANCPWPRFNHDNQNTGRITGSVCGDGRVDAPYEVCDDGFTNGQPNNCNTHCSGPVPPYCGNGVTEPENNTNPDNGEVCDDGNYHNGNPTHCKQDCSGYVRPVCGNGWVERNVPGYSHLDETCDDGVSGQIWSDFRDPQLHFTDVNTDFNGLVSPIQLPNIGFGCVNVAGNIPTSQYGTGGQGNCRCLNDCKKRQRCGDNVKDGTEWCDDGSGNNGKENNCNGYCNDYVPQDCGNDIKESTGPKMNPNGSHGRRDSESCDDGGSNCVWPWSCCGCGSHCWGLCD